VQRQANHKNISVYLRSSVDKIFICVYLRINTAYEYQRTSKHSYLDENMTLFVRSNTDHYKLSRAIKKPPTSGWLFFSPLKK